MRRLRGQYDALQSRLDKLLDLFIDGKIKEEDHNRKLTEIKEKQQKINIELEGYTDADESYHITARTVLSLAQRAKELFESSEVEEKRQILNLILQNCHIESRKLVYKLKTPFDTVLLANDSLIWLRGSDSNRQPTG